MSRKGPRTDPQARYWAKVDRSAGPDGCWLWTASRTPLGYGWFYLAGRPWHAQKFAYEWIVGPIPDGLVLDHLCRVPACVNPAHLEPVTPRENSLRSTSPIAQNGCKTHCPKGHPYSSENTYCSPSEKARRCRICRLAVYRAYGQRRRARQVA